MNYGASTPAFHRKEIIHRISGGFAMCHATSPARVTCHQNTAFTPVVLLHL